MMNNRIEDQAGYIQGRVSERGLARSTINHHPSSKGFSMISAIFLVVVIAALAAFSMTLFTTQQRTAALDVLGEQAYQASRAGIEWGAYQILQNSGGAFALSCRPGPAPAQAVALTGTLASFAVTVNCAAASSVENATTLWVYQLTSTATQGTQATPNYLERQMQVTIAP